jgi:hypothetical protein
LAAIIKEKRKMNSHRISYLTKSVYPDFDLLLGKPESDPPDETALVLNEEQFFILNGNHVEEYSKLNGNIKDMVKYFITNYNNHFSSEKITDLPVISDDSKFLGIYIDGVKQ